MDNEQEIIMISHLPTLLTDELIIEFLSYYQPSKIVLGQGRYKGKATVYFDEHEKASFMFQSLNQRVLLGKKLSAKKVTEGKLSKYKYLYPPANENTIQNIAKELRKNPSFYVSVLHVMNKLKLHPPFSPANATVRSELSGDDAFLSGNLDKLTENEDQEPENEGEHLAYKRTKLDESSHLNVHHKSVVIDHKASIRKKPTQLLKIIMPSTLTNTEPTISNHLKQEKSEVLCSSNFFQALQPIKHHTLSLEEIRANKLTIDEIKLLPKFSSWTPGIPSSRLYIKNLNPKKVTKMDLLKIFSRYSDKETLDDIEIKLMVKGKLKGQAFVTFTNEELASQAMREVNGYLLYDKPMIIEYGKAPKPNQE